jgi:hypothetical protein
VASVPAPVDGRRKKGKVASPYTQQLRQKRINKEIVKIAEAQGVPVPAHLVQKLAKDADKAQELATVANKDEILASMPRLGAAAARRAMVAGDAPDATADDVTINAWADRRANINLVDAILEKEHQLKYGTPDQRNRAADSFLKMTGRDQKDGPISGGATIILNMGDARLPFAPRAQTVDVAALSKGDKDA